MASGKAQNAQKAYKKAPLHEKSFWAFYFFMFFS
jgi:hypothetical protein